MQAVVAGPYHAERGVAHQPRRPRDPARRLLPPLAGPVPRRRRGHRHHPAGVRVLRGALRPPVPVREVRPALRARVQRRRDGERRRGHDHRALRLPVEGAARRWSSAAALTILHELAHMWFGDLVTMRWWDDLWLNESFAEYASTRCQAEATRWRDGVDDVQQRREVLGLPAGPAGDHAPDRRRHPRPRGRRGQLRRHHLRQGRVGAQAARALRRARGVRRRACGATSGSTRGATPTLRDLLAELEATSGRDLDAWARLWLQQAGVTTLRPEHRDRSRTASSPRSPSSRRRPPSTPCCGRTASRSAATTSSTAGCARTRRVELDVDRRRAPTVPELRRRAAPGAAARQRRRPRLREDPARRARRSRRRSSTSATFADALPRVARAGAPRGT